MMRLLPCGQRAVLVELTDPDAVLGFHAALIADRPVGVDDVVPAATTVLVQFDPTKIDEASLARHLLGLRPIATDDAAPAAVAIEVCYDGEDLGEVAELSALTVDEVVARHTAAHYRVAFIGFAPGFAYLVGGDPSLHVPRRDAPRTAVPAGSVALAGPYSGIYPRSMPGGWRLIGRTTAALWVLDRDPPALLSPGTAVTFRAVRGG